MNQYRLLPVLGVACSMMSASTCVSAQVNNHSYSSIKPGQAYVTRFSGTRVNPKTKRHELNLDGVVGSIIDVRKPLAPHRGQHWFDVPHRYPVLAKDIGQVFGIAIDHATPKNIYVTATAKFGLHRTRDNQHWAAGQWGVGPGSIYVLRGKNHYQPVLFANVTLNGRPNTGAALGNIVYDARHQQLFVSDLETGMIFRYLTASGVQKGYFDQGLSGRGRFFNKLNSQRESLPKVAFDPKSHAHIHDCVTPFETTPVCWNLADPRRRVYGLGLHKEAQGTQRLYYAAALDKDDTESAIWSVGINQNGGFNQNDVRLELRLPSNRSGVPQMVSDIAFSNKNEMLVAETGPFLNKGLDQLAPFSMPHNARLFLYRLNGRNQWVLQKRVNVGNKNSAVSTGGVASTSSAGGTDFGYGYRKNYTVNRNRPYDFIWNSGDALCSDEGPCFDLRTDQSSDTYHVHGVQGVPKKTRAPIEGSLPGIVLNSYMIDTDFPLVVNGQRDPNHALKDDATKIGDIEVVKHQGKGAPRLAPPVYVHAYRWSHSRYGSHYKRYSWHKKVGSYHQSTPSHRRYRSHSRYPSHYKTQSLHRKYGSTHYSTPSHRRVPSHARHPSHYKQKSLHRKRGSYPSHYKRKSLHQKSGSYHDKIRSPHGTHRKTASHRKVGSHSKARSHYKTGSHNKKRSHIKTGSHSKARSHAKVGSHSKTRSHYKTGSHNKKRSHLKTGSHSKARSHAKVGSHSKVRSRANVRPHSKARSHSKDRSRARVRLNRPKPAKINRSTHLKSKSQAKKRLMKKRSHTKSRSENAVKGLRVSKSQTRTHLMLNKGRSMAHAPSAMGASLGHQSEWDVIPYAVPLSQAHVKKAGGNAQVFLAPIYR